MKEVKIVTRKPNVAIAVIATKLMGKGGGLTIPEIGIFVNPRSMNDKDLLKHEFGHVLQHRKLGPPLYYLRKALPSLLSAIA